MYWEKVLKEFPILPCILISWLTIQAVSWSPEKWKGKTLFSPIKPFIWGKESYLEGGIFGFQAYPRLYIQISNEKQYTKIEVEMVESCNSTLGLLGSSRIGCWQYSWTCGFQMRWVDGIVLKLVGIFMSSILKMRKLKLKKVALVWIVLFLLLTKFRW